MDRRRSCTVRSQETASSPRHFVSSSANSPSAGDQDKKQEASAPETQDCVKLVSKEQPRSPRRPSVAGSWLQTPEPGKGSPPTCTGYHDITAKVGQKKLCSGYHRSPTILAFPCCLVGLLLLPGTQGRRPLWRAYEYFCPWDWSVPARSQCVGFLHPPCSVTTFPAYTGTGIPRHHGG